MSETEPETEPVRFEQQNPASLKGPHRIDLRWLAPKVLGEAQMLLLRQ